MIAVIFLDFSSTLTKILLIISGLAVAILNFWTASLLKPILNKKSEAEIMPDNFFPAPASEASKKQGRPRQPQTQTQNQQQTQ